MKVHKILLWREVLKPLQQVQAKVESLLQLKPEPNV